MESNRLAVRPIIFEAQGIDRRRWPSFEQALAALARSEFLEPVAETDTGLAPPATADSETGENHR